MNIETVIIGVIVLGAVVYLTRAFIKTIKSGSCSCGDEQGDCCSSDETKNGSGCSGCQSNRKD